MGPGLVYVSNLPVWESRLILIKIFSNRGNYDFSLR